MSRPLRFRQADVQQQKIERVLFELCEAGFAVSALRRRSLRSSKDFEAFADFRFVINYKNRTLRHDRFLPQEFDVEGSALPGVERTSIFPAVP